jgi:hypothetical protein
MPSRCTQKFLKYEFDVDGHTVARCGSGDRYMEIRGIGNVLIHREGRKMCPHYGGKCPALVGVDK